MRLGPRRKRGKPRPPRACEGPSAAPGWGPGAGRRAPFGAAVGVAAGVAAGVAESVDIPCARLLLLRVAR